MVIGEVEILYVRITERLSMNWIALFAIQYNTIGWHLILRNQKLCVGFYEGNVMQRTAWMDNVTWYRDMSYL